jgi:hypothetical protein
MESARADQHAQEAVAYGQRPLNNVLTIAYWQPLPETIFPAVEWNQLQDLPTARALDREAAFKA